MFRFLIYENMLMAHGYFIAIEKLELKKHFLFWGNMETVMGVTRLSQPKINNLTKAKRRE